jgi:hypothetical protein
MLKVFGILQKVSVLLHIYNCIRDIINVVAFPYLVLALFGM